MAAAAYRGFTLIELLVVITIIVVLLALLAPALDKAIESAVRARCASQQHGLVQIFNTYASERSNRKYPAGNRDFGDELAIEVSTPFVELVVSYAGNNKNQARATSQGAGLTPTRWGVVPPILIDPSYNDFGWHGSNGWGIGYNYLGGRPFTSKANAPWQSPMGLSNMGSGQMISCLNNWVDNSRLWVAHGAEGGPLGGDAYVAAYWVYRADSDPRGSDLDATADDLSAGGNIGRADGSVAWKDLTALARYYSVANTDGAWSANWHALW